MSKNDILIIKAVYPVKKDDMITVYRNILEQTKNGLVLLPFGYEVVVVPKDIEVRLGQDKDEEKVIHNAVSYICMADKNDRAGEAERIAQLLYDRAYRKGFEAGKAEGHETIVEKTVYETVDPNEDWEDFKG